MLSKQVMSKLLLLIAISSIALVAAVACAEEAEEPAAAAQPAAARAAEDAAAAGAPQAPTGKTGAARSAAAPKAAAGTVAKAAAPAKPKAGEAAGAAAAAAAPKAAAAAADPRAATMTKTTRTGLTGVVRNLADSQVATTPSGTMTNAAPWRDGGRNREFSPYYAATFLMLNEDGTFRSWLAASWSVNEGQDVFTFKIRDDAVYQDGTPVKASDLKAFWEYGGMPENIIAWGGSMLLGLRDIAGMQDLMAGDTTVADGLVAIDDLTLEVTMAQATPTFPHVVTIDQTGFTKFEQIVADPEEWHFEQIVGVGPYVFKIDKQTGYGDLTRADLMGAQWWGDNSGIEKVHYLNIADEQVKLIMFENGEVDWVRISGPTVTEALDPTSGIHQFHRTGAYGGLYYFSLASGLEPLEDVFVRQALAHGVDMDTVIKAVLGVQESHSAGYMTANISCHQADWVGAAYDPDLARQFVAESSYGSAANMPVIRVDLSNAQRINIGVATKEYWKDNLDIELDILKRESGMPRREGSQLIRRSSGSPVMDPIWLTNGMRGALTDNLPGREIVDSLWSYAVNLPLGHPDRCSAFRAVERDMIESAYIIPHEALNLANFLVQPWVKGWARPFSQEITYLDIFIEKH